MNKQVKFRNVLKYRNVRETVDGINFHSKREAKRYLELKLLNSSKEIMNLSLQPNFKFIINGVKVCTYRADFMYFTKENKCIVEDVKGYKTPLFVIKAKLFKALYPNYELILT